MQVARLSRGERSRTYGTKMIEMLQALKLEIFRSKNEILRIYAANAPFGGNTVGLDAAAWRYTGKSPADITWAEASALAVLPNSPSLVYPGRNQETLKNRRNELLKKLYEREYFDSLTLVLSLDEPLPGVPKLLPSKASHLTDLFYKRNRGERIRTTIDPVLQERAADIINSHQEELAGNFIFNSAALILNVATGDVLAYIGNSTEEDFQSHGGNVDIIRSLRSTGSILKPILYAGMQQSGELLPNTLVADIPTRFPGFAPKNFDQSFSGAVPAGSALSQSLNIPAVGMLQKYTPERFLGLMKSTGFTTFDKQADYYGLSLILGGGETSLWELTGVYASLSRVLGRFNREKKYIREDYHPPVLLAGNTVPKDFVAETNPILSAGSIWLTYEALRKVNRPETETGWQYFASAPEIAWKTGTSFGFRDAWAVGTTPDYVIGVWTGNADGEGRPGLTGISAAAPILFDLVGIMKPVAWFTPPYEEMTTVRVCSQSGYRAGPDCPETEEISICINGLRSDACPFHRIIHLDKTRTKQVTADCVPASEIINESWFVLSPAMEYFYRQKHAEYKPLPPFVAGCGTRKTIPVMEFIYPTQGIRIFIPRDHTGELTRVIAEVVHRDPSKKIFWHLDEKYITATKFIHQTEIYAVAGNHVLTLVDEDGNTIKCSFTIIMPPA
jgi:penicillin-binding protein 1C